MGLQPERIGDAGAAPDARIAAPCFRMAFGAVSILAGPAAGVALDLADPDHPSTSLLAASLPRGWRESGDCWIFIPANPRAAAPPETTRRRELFKMMVLLKIGRATCRGRVCQFVLISGVAVTLKN